MIRCKSLSEVLRIMEDYLPIKDFNPFNWLMDDRNICLTDGKDSLTLFEYDDGIYNGHYFYKLRGKEAVSFSKECLKSAFDDYGIVCLRGYTPKSNKGALWLSRHLGFVPSGVIFIEGEENQIWLMDRMGYTEKHHGQ